MKRFYIICLMAFLLSPSFVKAQFNYGTTGLLHMPTGEMQKDKTFLFGGGYLNSHALPAVWSYDTWNYYINITFFPWLEVAYTCTIFDDYVQRGQSLIHRINQDRNFSGRLRLWKEGWWKEWTIQSACTARPT